MRPTPHILVVNGIKVRRPVFVLGAPHSGADLLARALKRSFGFHLTVGRPSVARVVYAFARRPSIPNGKGTGATRVLRDALAESWQLTPGGCQDCPALCRDAGGLTTQGACVTSGGISRFGDASPDLLYSARVLLEAFPDARLIQLIRDGRDVAADMLADPACLAWFKPALLAEGTEFPNPFLGINKAEHREKWSSLPTAGKCALRWRNAVRISARLRAELPADQLLTVRYEDLITQPNPVIESVSRFLEARVSLVALHGAIGATTTLGASGSAVAGGPVTGAWRTRLRPDDAALIEKIAQSELLRLGYIN
ncbi:sulfotransferase family protein [Rhizohabitans arisaemae]|uniref:sulfotransferase family protein n=1 Tax=Rhizohabitans arisaemae TaxID=2720610 RepID=UPI0024B057EF|nr:sulfotransferase [Rhizohabitans arisaemae]